tara:strand:- start:121 stop:1299 length:1179 start_codon:yes stop_codon:yes gene_type:complete
MKENCKEHFNKIIKKYEKDIELSFLKKTLKLKSLIKDFIIENNLILYGGTAIDLLLPTNSKIYKKNQQLFDYDVYSNNAYKYGVKLVDLLVKNKYKYVQLREAAFTRDTYKIFIENLPVFDITNLTDEKYEVYLNLAKKKNKMLVVSPEILIRDMCSQLSQPHISYFRLDKTYERYKLFNNIFGIKKYQTNKIKLHQPTLEVYQILKKILNICKKNGYPLTGYYALQILNNNNINNFYSINNETPYLSFFTKDFQKIINLLEGYNITTIKYLNYITIYYNNINLCNIYDSSNLCISFCQKKGFNILTIFGIKYFIYDELIQNNNINETTKYIIYQLNKYIKNNNCLENCKFNMKCYGDGKPPGWDIIKSRWNDGIIKYKAKQQSKLKTFFNN